MSEEHPLARMLKMIAQRSATEAVAQTDTEANCPCSRCTSLREVKAAMEAPEKVAARAALPWRWHTVLSKENGKPIGACWVDGRDTDEALYRALYARLSPGGNEFQIQQVKVGFIPFGRWTGRPLSLEEWELLQTIDSKQIGVQLDE